MATPEAAQQSPGDQESQGALLAKELSSIQPEGSLKESISREVRGGELAPGRAADKMTAEVADMQLRDEDATAVVDFVADSDESPYTPTSTELKAGYNQLRSKSFREAIAMDAPNAAVVARELTFARDNFGTAQRILERTREYPDIEPGAIEHLERRARQTQARVQELEAHTGNNEAILQAREKWRVINSELQQARPAGDEKAIAKLEDELEAAKKALAVISAQGELAADSAAARAAGERDAPEHQRQYEGLSGELDEILATVTSGGVSAEAAKRWPDFVKGVVDAGLWTRSDTVDGRGVLTARVDSIGEDPADASLLKALENTEGRALLEKAARGATQADAAIYSGPVRKDGSRHLAGLRPDIFGPVPPDATL